MSDKYIDVFLFRKQADSAIRFLHEIAYACNLSFYDTTTNAFITWTAKGRILNSDISQLQEYLSNGIDIAFQMWYQAGEDLFCTVSYTEDLISTRFFLSGVAGARFECLLVALHDLMACAAFADEFAALIVDPNGFSAEIPWEIRLIEGFEESEVFPDNVTISKSLPVHATLDPERHLQIIVTDRIVRIVQADHVIRFRTEY